MKESKKFRRGLEHFNAREFFEAHEAWEELWLVEAEPEKTFLQGLIQLAAAFHHYGRGNMRGARSLFAAGIAKLARFPDDHRGLALGKLRAKAEQWAKTLEADKGPGKKRPPKIQLVAGAVRKKKRGG
jgi:predicted metal-dependent hydrolase